MSFQSAAKVSLQDAQLRRNLGKATTLIRAKRERAVAEVPDWEALRDAGEAIKADSMLAEMTICQRGTRLSITPVDPLHFKRVCKLASWKP